MVFASGVVFAFAILAAKAFVLPRRPTPSLLSRHGQTCPQMAAPSTCAATGLPQQPNPPRWPPSVLIFSPDMSAESIEAVVKYRTSHLWDSSGHYSSDRIALLFKPGTYHASVQVGYYVQVAGLGLTPDDVRFEPADEHASVFPGVYAPAADVNGSGSLDTFWRVAENFFTSPRGWVDQVPSMPPDDHHMTWAVSQAAPLRRVRTDQKLWLFQLHWTKESNRTEPWALFASGGFAANVRAEGGLNAGGQQQFLLRNCDFPSNRDADSTPGGAWSLVFSGCTGGGGFAAPPNGLTVYTILEKTALLAEKPFVTFDNATGKYSMQVPGAKWGSTGASFDPSENQAIPFESVFVATPESVADGSLQEMLDIGLSVVLAPGIYYLNKSLVVKHHNQVVLGLGLATLVAPPDGSGPCVRVLRNTFGVRLSGFMLQASAVPAPASKALARPGSTLLLWGADESGAPADHDAQRMEEATRNPGFMHDIFARVGGPDVDTSVNVETIVRVAASHVVGDNLWLWRADHSKLAPRETPRPGEKYHLIEHKFGPDGSVAAVEARCSTGLHVTGNHVTVNGLAVEHVQKDQVVWEGDDGRVVFYQCELPYDVRQDTFLNPATGLAYVGYNIVDSERMHNHELHAPGIYSFFRDYTVYVHTAITAPSGVKVVNPFTVRLKANRGIVSVLNGDNPVIDSAMPIGTPVRP